MMIRLCLCLALCLWGAQAASEEGKSEQHFWKVKLGNICQLPAIPRAAGIANMYLECVRLPKDLNGGRDDLGLWVMNECLKGYEFVASAQRCKPKSSVRRMQATCSGPQATNTAYCPQATQAPITVQQQQPAAQSCGCPVPQMSNCVCPSQPVIQPVRQPVVVTTPAPVVQQQPCPTQCTPQQQTTCPCLSNLKITVTVQQCPCPQQQTVCSCPAPQPAPQPVPVPTPAPQPICPCPQPQPQPSPCTCPQPQPQPVPQPIPQPVVQPQPCAQAQGSGGQGAAENGICSWMLDPLAAHPDKKFFLQCQPAPGNVFCGRWRKMPCGPNTIFDVQLQVCTNDPNAPVGPLPPPQPITLPPYTPYPAPNPTVAPNPCSCSSGATIGQCGANYNCPGTSVCQVPQPQTSSSCNVCCYFG